MIAYMLVLVALTTLNVAPQKSGDELAPHIRALQNSRDALQMSVKQVKAKPNGDAAAVAALEKQFGALAETVGKWQSAATGAMRPPQWPGRAREGHRPRNGSVRQGRPDLHRRPSVSP